MIIPPRGLRTPSGRKVPWECCVTMNNNWGYCANDLAYKSADVIVRKLVECVSKDGNLIMNVGPNAKGEIPAESVKILQEVGAWMARNGESIYGCGSSELDKPEWGRLTQKGDMLYAHVMEQTLGPVALLGMKGKADYARRVDDGSEVFMVDSWAVSQFKEDLFLSLDRGGSATILLPDKTDFVLKVKLKG